MNRPRADQSSAVVEPGRQRTPQQTLIDVDPQARRAFDYYPTPAWMTLALINRVHPFDVLEPCSGQDAIADVFRAKGQQVVTNDLNPETPAQFHLDATKDDTWEALTYPFSTKRIMWGVTNLPFDLADQVVPLAVKHLPYFATILRLSWLEPTAARQRFLAANPPKTLIVLPRHDWRGNGSTDSVTSAWFIWERGISATRGIEVVTKDERDELIASLRGGQQREGK